MPDEGTFKCIEISKPVARNQYHPAAQSRIVRIYVQDTRTGVPNVTCIDKTNGRPKYSGLVFVCVVHSKTSNKQTIEKSNAASSPKSRRQEEGSIVWPLVHDFSIGNYYC